jgi:hypothetical protein
MRGRGALSAHDGDRTTRSGGRLLGRITAYDSVWRAGPASQSGALPGERCVDAEENTKPADLGRFIRVVLAKRTSPRDYLWVARGNPGTL